MQDDTPVLGVIDVGTNTCHLLIAAFREGRPIRDIYRERRFVKLAENGIDTIRPEALQRGLAAIRHFNGIIQEHEVAAVRVIGTAALRTATNGKAFMDEVFRETGLRMECISGDEEARLIHSGVSMAVPFGIPYRLIVDIGGGSVECILANRRGVAWARSFPVGLAVLFHRFHRHDPMTPEDRREMDAWLQRQLAPLDDALARFQPIDLVGAAGTFEVLAEALEVNYLSGQSAQFSLEAMQAYSRPFLETSIAGRKAMPDLSEERADMFVLALLLLDHIACRAGLSTITTSTYAMKEGILREMAAGA